MKVFLIVMLVIVIIMIIVAGLYVVLKKKKNDNKIINVKKEKKTKGEVINKEMSLMVNNVENSFPKIQIVENDEVIPNEKSKVSSITMKKAIATIDNVMPNAALAEKNLSNGLKTLGKETKIFSASKDGVDRMLQVKGSDKVYGIQMLDGKFNRQTQFTKEANLIKDMTQTQLVNAAFSSASMIVGQYYMSEINDKLEDIEEDISEISDYLDTEYQSSLERIVSKLQEIIENKIEIMKNDYSRDKRYNEVIDLENDCTKLLGQANEMIKNNIAEDIDFKKYEKKVNDIQKWFSRQNILQYLLKEIGDLRYVLAYGNETCKLSHTQYNNYLKQINVVNDKLKEWHNKQIEKFGIDIKGLRRTGKMFKVKKNTIGKIKEEWAYNKISDVLAKEINKQKAIKNLNPINKVKKDEVIKIQKYNGDYFLLK